MKVLEIIPVIISKKSSSVLFDKLNEHEFSASNISFTN